VDKQRVAGQLVKLAKGLLSDESRIGAVAYNVIFTEYAGNLTSTKQTEKDVASAVKNYGVNSDIIRRIMNVIREQAKDIAAGKEVDLEFSLPIFIKNGKGDKVEIQFQT